eukprot:7085312-Alexandrium_andersonii.AAC.1
MCIRDSIWKDLGVVLCELEAWERLASTALVPKKCVLAPLFRPAVRAVKLMLEEQVPSAALFHVEMQAKYS